MVRMCCFCSLVYIYKVLYYSVRNILWSLLSQLSVKIKGNSSFLLP